MRFLDKILRGSLFKPSEKVIGAFNKSFPDALDVEWFKNKEFSEAVFYVNSWENIVKLDNEGNIIEIRENLPTLNVHDFARKLIPPKMELMNYIEIKKDNAVFCELIVRETPLKRHTLVINSEGEIITMKRL